MSKVLVLATLVGMIYVAEITTFNELTLSFMKDGVKVNEAKDKAIAKIAGSYIAYQGDSYIDALTASSAINDSGVLEF